MTDELDDAGSDDDQWEEHVDERLGVHAKLGRAVFAASFWVLAGAAVYTILNLALSLAYLGEEGAFVFNPDVGEVAPFSERVVAFADALGGVSFTALVGSGLLVLGLAFLDPGDRALRRQSAVLASHAYRILGFLSALAAVYALVIRVRNVPGLSFKTGVAASGLLDIGGAAAVIVLAAAALGLVQRPARLR